MESLAIIPARGGSEGIPGKNLMRVGGIELVARSVRTAHAAESVDRVVVSTDDDAIATVARREGAEVVERPSHLADSIASSESALVHALDVLDVRNGIVAMLQCTSPFTTADMIDGTIGLVRTGATCSFTVAPSHRFLWRVTPEGAVGINHDMSVRLRRQDIEPEYVETGAVYAMDVAAFRECQHRFVGRAELFVTDPARADEIDDPEDLERCRRLAFMLDPEVGPVMYGSVRAVAFDFDGVFTDDLVTVREDGLESVTCSRSDGMGLSLLREAGLRLVVLSKERNPVVQARCAKVGVEAVTAVDDKIGALRAWMDREDLSMGEVAFVGNDINDLDCLTEAALGVVPADAHPEAVAAANVVMSSPGGRGAIREFAELLIGARKITK